MASYHRNAFVHGLKDLGDSFSVVWAQKAGLLCVLQCQYLSGDSRRHMRASEKIRPTLQA